jgi:hypothetical protein
MQDVLVESDLLGIGGLCSAARASAISRFNRRSAVAACWAWSATSPVAVSLT